MFIFEFWATGLVIDAMEPALTEILLKLDENQIICPEEFSTTNYNICFGINGGVVVNGNFNKDFEMNLDGNQACIIKKGNYANVNICEFNNLWSSKKIFLSSGAIFGNKGIKISKLISYVKAGKYIKLVKFIKKFPIK